MPYSRNRLIAAGRAASAAFLAVLALGACTTGVGDAVAAASPGPVIGLDGDALTVSVGADRLELRFLSEKVLEANFLPGGASSPPTAVLAPGSRETVRARAELGADPVVFATGAMVAEARRDTGLVSIRDAAGRLVLGGLDPRRASAGAVSFSRAEGQDFYGISGFEAKAPSAQGILRNSGGPVKAGSQGYSGGPLAWTTSGYGLLVDSDGGRFDISDASISFSGWSRRNVDCYVMLGSPAEIMKGLSEVSGRAPMLPKWAMGFMNSQWGIDQRELEEIVAGYRSRGLPLDCMILDFDWKDWGADHYGEWNWNAAKFPGGPGGALKAEMDAAGARLVGIMKPRIRLDTEQGAYATSRGFWYPARQPYRDYFSKERVNDLDFSVPECRAWFFRAFEKSFDTGIAGWWNDEADGFDNFEFMNMQRSLYEGQRAYSEERVFSLNRNFYSGSQRYAYALWSGDIDTGFDSMAAQRDRLLSAACLGEAKWGMDAGGFAGTPSPENYARWIEFAAFVPIFRVHGTFGEKRQPWRYGRVAEKAASDAIRLRSRLVPYVYSYERRAYEDGLGLARPLCFEWPSDPRAANERESWMFGDWLLVSPVVAQGQKAKDVYLPAGTWIDWFRGGSYEGGRALRYAVDPASYGDIPLFVRAGAIIPSRDEAERAGAPAPAVLALDVFPSAAETGFAYYDDDGRTYGYERGEYFEQEIRTARGDEGARLSFSAPEGSYEPPTRWYLCRIHGCRARSASLGGADLPRAASAEALAASAGPAWLPCEDRYGPAAYAKVPAGAELLLLARADPRG